MKLRSTNNLGKFISAIIFSCLFIFATTLSSYAHTVNSYSTNCAAGPQYSVTANMSNNNSSSNYRWQWKNNSGSWICFVNGNNTINGNIYNVTGAVVNLSNLTTQTITITNPDSDLQGLEMRIVISDGSGVNPCTLPAGNTWTSSTNNFIHVTGTACGVNITDCACTSSAANLLSNASFENGNTSWSVSSGNITTGTGYIICGAANGFLNWSSGTAKAWQQVAAVAGNTYNATAYLGTHAAGINCSPKFLLSFYNASGTLLTISSANVTTNVDVSPNKPTLYSLSAVAPAGTANVRVETTITCNTMKMDAFCLTTTAPPCTGKVTGLYFNKLDGGTDLPITNGSTFTTSQLGSFYNLETSNSGTIGSVVYNITGPTASTNTENTAPYNNPGTGSGAFTGAVGTYNVNLKTYSGSNASGNICHDTTITFIISSGLSLGSRVWNDVNNNGINEATENGLANVTVNLYSDNDNDNYPDTTAAGDEILLASTITDAGGNYIFNNLNPGNYIVGVLSPSGYIKVANNGGDPDDNINLDNNGIYSISGGETFGWAITLAFGTEPNGSSSSTNYNDTYDFGFYTSSTSSTFCTGTLLTNANGYYGGFEIIPASLNLGPVSNPNPAGSELTLVYKGNISADKAIIATNGNSIPGGISLPPHSGNWLLLLHPKRNNERLWFKSVSVTPGSTYIFCAWGAGSKATPATMTLQLFMNGVNVGTGTITNAGTWTQVCGSYTVPAGVTTMEISIKDPTAGDGGPSHFVALDDICFTEISRRTNPDFNSTFVNVAVPGNVSTNDQVPSGTTYGTSPTLLSSPAGSVATLTMNSNGTYSFTANTPGVYTYDVPVCVPGQVAPCPPTKLVITVLGASSNTNAPVANADVATTNLNTAVTLRTLANDASGNANTALVPSSVTVTSAPTRGTATVNATTGDITYTPNAGFSGRDTLTYQVCDNQTPPKCATAVQIITVNPAGTPNSTAAADDYKITLINTAATGNVKTNDTDAEGNMQTVTAQTTTVSGKGTLVLNTNGSYTFTPVTGFTGPVDFPYTTCDNGTPQACASATLHILVKPLGDVPDLTPRINLNPNNIIGVSSLEITVQVNELRNVSTNGSTITLFVDKQNFFSNFTFNSAQTTNLAGQPIQNNLFSIDAVSNPDFYVITTNAAFANSLRRVTFSVTVNPGQTKGTTPLNVFLQNGSGGEINFTNNSSFTILTFSF